MSRPPTLSLHLDNEEKPTDVPSSQPTSKQQCDQTEQSDPVVVVPFSDDTGERKHLQLDEITLDEVLWSRAEGLRQDVIDEFREALQRGEVFPPVTVFFDGKNHFLVDGWYRYYAYQSRTRNGRSGQTGRLEDIATSITTRLPNIANNISPP